ncbi:DNA-binding transcriptional regulator, XRE-family HTH domain [Dethiosulfovibrio salsuginis]|uniref:DNA-binding transcriptional regulator, XRE-family HTH domain n=2 Tax=Dethiosulfovibrio salsuginis TaxID=561720 RepID=A0A1X7KJ78_9BACT|nr:DNA-binding transcriptional regulator, XRE-family HTH domain [Dethiosulfovibrio salsuginis]
MGGFLAERMKSLRAKAGLNQKDLADITGISRNTVINYEGGKRVPDADSLVEIAKALKTTSSYLNGETDDPSPAGATKGQDRILRPMREQTGLSLEAAAALINLPVEDLEMMEIYEDRADDKIKDRLIKAYGRYLSMRDGENHGTEKKGQSEEDLETLIKMLAAEDPDIVLKFRRVAKNATRLAPKDREFLVTLFKAALGQIELEDHTDEY